MSTRRERELIAQNRLLVRQEGLAEREIAKVIREMAEDVASRLSYGDEQASLQIVDEHRPALAAALEKRLQQTALLFGGRTMARLKPYLPKSYYGAIPLGTGPVRGRDEFPLEGVIRTLGMDAKDAREVFEGSVLQWVRRHALKRANGITATLKREVRKVLVESFADGTGEAGTAKAIRERIGKQLSATNAARIARTEMHTASTIGSDQAARSTGLTIIKEWAAAEDSRTRASHNAADGQEVPLDDPFSVGGASMMVPGDPSAPAREVINCRCAILHHPVIGGMVIRDDGPPSPPRITQGPAPVSDPAKADEEARSYVLENGRASGVEHLSAYDAATGEQFPTASGTFDSVQLPAAVVSALANPKARVVLHHNHPRSSSLSGPDLQILIRPGAAAIYAHGHNGSKFRAARGEKAINKAEIQRDQAAVYSWLNALVQARIMSTTDASILHAHIAWLRLQKRGRVAYEAELKGEIKDAVERHSALIDEFLKD